MLLSLFFSLKMKTESASLLEFQWFDEDFYSLIFRLAVNLTAMTILIRLLYYPKTKRLSVYLLPYRYDYISNLFRTKKIRH
jgi:hypothetical protein